MTAAGIQLRATVLDALGETADRRRDRNDSDGAEEFEAAAAIIRRVTSDHWLIAVLRGDTTATRGNTA